MTQWQAKQIHIFGGVPRKASTSFLLQNKIFEGANGELLN